MLLAPAEIGLASVSAAVTLAAVRTIDYLVRQKSSKNGIQSPSSICRAQCDANEVIDRLREYHIENRQILQDIRDGIKLLAVIYRERQTEKRKESR
jgi:hypothetical protein